MSSDVVIQVEHLGKKYVVGHQTVERYTALRDVIARHAKNYLRTAADIAHGRPIYSGDSLEEFWALKDVSFQINRGDVVGIIGRNGAGKSTLLKILSRITEPTTGRVTIDGRVASLLEVGTGFHPELSGRENIYLNGAILGMSRAEIHRKFDEIVAFAEVERFLDTPVKRYSSGMYVRLAFAVAAHLEPEILIVDEVLAVGDAEFQRKCIKRMDDIAREGKTVIVVSHNISVLASMCHSGVWLRDGSIKAAGPSHELFADYVADVAARGRGDKTFEISGLKAKYSFHFDSSTGLLHCSVAADVSDPITIKAIHFFMQTSLGIRAAIIDLLPPKEVTQTLIVGSHKIGRVVDTNVLSSDSYIIGFHLLTTRGDFTDWSAGMVVTNNPASRYSIEYQGVADLRDAK